MNIYLELFWSIFQVGLFCFGGGYASLPLIQHQVVDIHGWISMAELSDMITISQMTPGPIALNISTFVGFRQAGLLGAIVASFACVLPSCIICSIFAFLYFRYNSLDIVKGVLGGLRPAVVALIASAGLSILIQSFWGESGFSLLPASIDWIAVLLFAAAFVTLRKTRLNSIWVILGCGLVGAGLYYVTG